MLIQELFMQILSMSTTASIILFLIMLARKVLKNKVDFSKICLLWIIFIITLIIPITFSSHLSVKNYIKPNIDTQYIDTNNGYNISNANLQLNMTSDKINMPNYFLIISYIWILVAIILNTKDMIVYNTFLKVSVKNYDLRDVNNILQECKEKLGIKKNIEIVLQDKVKTPSLYGIFNTKILLTSDVLRLSTDEKTAIILHELNHYIKKHHIIYVFLKFIERLHWFNPVIYIGIRKIKQDLEIITDRRVLDSGVEVKGYYKTIVKVAGLNAGYNSFVPNICGDKSELERRISTMKQEKINSKYGIILFSITIILMSLVTISLASEKVENNDMEIINEKRNNVEFARPLENIKVSMSFGKRIHPLTKEELYHTGVDLVAQQGTPVMAVADGTVIYANFDKEYGNLIKIEHKDNSISTYAHGSEILVKEGQKVIKGQTIMKVGSTGMATGPHLHFEIINSKGEYVDINNMFE